MPNVKDCIAVIKGASPDVLTDKDAQELLGLIKRMGEERARKKGVEIADAIREIAGELTVKDRAKNAVKKRQQLLNILKFRDEVNFISRFENPEEGFRAMLEGVQSKTEGSRLSIDYQSKSIASKYFLGLDGDLKAIGSNLGEVKEHKKDIFIEMYEMGPEGKPGSSGNKKAQQIAEVLDRNNQELVARLNRAGADIAKIPGYILQTHDPMRIRKEVGEGFSKKGQSASYKAWSDFIAPLLDVEKTFEGADPQHVLREIHRDFYAGDHTKGMEEQDMSENRKPSSLADRLGSHRYLIFKDGESAFAYNEKYGSKDLLNGIVGNIHSKAKSLALMERLGANPPETFRRLRSHFIEKAKLEENSDKLVADLNSKALDKAYAVVSGASSRIADEKLGVIGQGIRALVSTAKMGGSLFASIGDPATMYMDLKFQGKNGFSAIADGLSNFVQGENGIKKGRLLGLGIEGMSSEIGGRQGFERGPSALLGAAQEKLYKWNLLNRWTDAMKTAHGEAMAGHLGDNSHLPFDKINPELARALNLYEISGKSWDALRSTAYDHPELGAKIISPDKVADISLEAMAAIVKEQGLSPTEANIQRGRDYLETQLRTFYADRADSGIVTPGAWERRILTQGTQAGTIEGEVFRALTMFKAFPLAVYNKQISRDIQVVGGLSGKFRVAQMVAMTTVAGWMGTSIRDLLKGRQPLMPFNDDGSPNMKVIFSSMAKGGGGSLYGDLLMNEYNTSGKSLLSAVAGPVAGQLGPIGDLYTRMVTGDNFAPQAFRFAKDNTPFLNLFYVRPVVDYFVLWNIQEMVSPGSLQRMEQMMERENGQKFFIHPSEVVNR